MDEFEFGPFDLLGTWARLEAGRGVPQGAGPVCSIIAIAARVVPSSQVGVPAGRQWVTPARGAGAGGGGGLL
jgi:hypothetical protein